MGSIPEILDYLKYGRSMLLESIEGLSQRELTEAPIYGNWTIKDVLAHVIGWDKRVLKTLPLMVQGRANEVPGVDVEAFNRQSVEAAKDKTFTELFSEIQATHQQILDFISELDHMEIDRRHERNGRIITIRSYVIEIMVEHERQHAVEIEHWRKELEQSIDPDAIRRHLQVSRADFRKIVDQFSEADVQDKSAVGRWSINDLVGHVADWEQRMLKAAQHIHDPSKPAVLPVSESSANWNEIMATRRAGKTWAENYHYLLETQLATEDFVASLRAGDWKLRGPYPWPDDQGTLAELIMEIAVHYDDHIPDVERWHRKLQDEPHA
jgi:uncharacterized damage-inducible protein DinB